MHERFCNKNPHKQAGRGGEHSKEPGLKENATLTEAASSIIAPKTGNTASSSRKVGVLKEFHQVSVRDGTNRPRQMGQGSSAPTKFSFFFRIFSKTVLEVGMMAEKIP